MSESKLPKKEESKLIMALYPHTPTPVLAEMYGKSVQSIWMMAKRYGVKKNGNQRQMRSKSGKYFTDEEITRILDDYKCLPNKQVAEKYDLKLTQLESLVRIHGVHKNDGYKRPRNQPRKQKINNYLELAMALYPNHPTEYIARRTGICIGTIYQNAKKRGIKKDKEIRKIINSKNAGCRDK